DEVWLFCGRAVALGGSAVVFEMAGGPEHAAGHKVQVTRVANGRVIVSDGGAEHARLLRTVLIRPDDHKIIRLAAVIAIYDLGAARERPRAVKDADIVVVLFFDGRPIAEAFGERIVRIEEVE